MVTQRLAASITMSKRPPAPPRPRAKRNQSLICSAFRMYNLTLCTADSPFPRYRLIILHFFFFKQSFLPHSGLILSSMSGRSFSPTDPPPPLRAYLSTIAQRETSLPCFLCRFDGPQKKALEIDRFFGHLLVAFFFKDSKILGMNSSSRGIGSCVPRLHDKSDDQIESRPAAAAFVCAKHTLPLTQTPLAKRRQRQRQQQ